jgi:ParB family chromosome partitioning protein
MAEPKLLEVAQLDPADIEVGSRLRPVTDAGVDSLVCSIKEIGFVKDEVIVRKMKGGRLKLIAGGHRHAACLTLGVKVPAKIYRCTDDWARLVEIDDNLAGAEMNALDSAIFLAERKRVYEKMHPETVAGYAGAASRWDAADIVSFASSTAEKFGVTERHVRRLAAAGSTLREGEALALRSAVRAVTLKDLGDLAKITDHNERDAVLTLFVSGDERSISSARSAHQRSANGPNPDATTPVDDAFKALLKCWNRAPAAARRRFVEEVCGDLNEMLAQPSPADASDNVTRLHG